MKKYTFQSLCSALAKIEGKKHQASIGDIREIISDLSKLLAADLITENGLLFPKVDGDALGSFSTAPIVLMAHKHATKLLKAHHKNLEKRHKLLTAKKPLPKELQAEIKKFKATYNV